MLIQVCWFFFNSSVCLTSHWSPKHLWVHVNKAGFSLPLGKMEPFSHCISTHVCFLGTSNIFVRSSNSAELLHRLVSKKGMKADCICQMIYCLHEVWPVSIFLQQMVILNDIIKLWLTLIFLLFSQNLHIVCYKKCIHNFLFLPSDTVF